MKEKPETKLCKYCKTEIPYDAKVCPNCRKKQGMNLILKIVIVIVALAVIGGVIGGTSSESSSSNSASDSNSSLNSIESIASNGLELVGGVESVEIEKDAFSWYFKGTVVNNKKKDLSYCQIEINLYDADGALLGTAVDNVNNLKAGGKWKFKAMTLLTSDELAEVANWELGEITGF